MHFAKTILIASLVFTTGAAYAQGNDSKKKDDSDELMNMLNQQDAGKKEKTYTTATFKTTRIINGASIENVAKGVLDFKISHRFGAFNTGFNGFFGLDNANTSLGFDYGISDRVMVGISRGTYEKEYEGYTKIKLLRQTEGGSMPVSVSYMGAISIQSLPAPTLPAGQDYHFSNRMYYVNQVLIAKKISQALSLQLTPTHIHYNLVSTTAEPNDLFAVGIGGRLKLTNRISLNAEYYYRINKLGNSSITYYNSLSLGFDIETGGHVFQLLFTNAPGITERVFVGQTSVSWPDGLRFGFNISRVFTIVKPKEFEGSRNKIW